MFSSARCRWIQKSWPKKIRLHADAVLISGMNYLSKTAAVYRRLGIMQWLDKGYTDDVSERLKKGMAGKDIAIC